MPDEGAGHHQRGLNGSKPGGSVFYKDYSTDPFCFGLKPGIDKLIFIHERTAEGETL